ncbi:FecR domain-containing protein [Dyella halodurans]|uniref:DUF6600 domain-containing protein n=1 Tax=Dyella halodurans TaxID=1920171 RepID=A0ABV9C7U1_9GAMM|nr:DUF6600 domain-containing protein [Dyella halodurans]
MRVFPASLTSPRGWRWLAAALLIGVGGLALAQAQTPDGDSAGDPPSRVARLSYRTGDVGLLPAGTKDWGDASLNRPLTTGDRLSTGQNARAELELGGGTLRIADDSDFGFLTLNDQLTQVELTQGTLNLSVRGLAEGQSYEIDTPTVALVVDQPGNFRVDIGDDGKSTRIIDFDGRAVVYGEGNTQRNVASGRSYEFADSSLNNVVISDIDGGDDFDAWSNSRDQRNAQEQSQSDRYVSDEVVGAQDLNQYGNWQADPDYGQVWYPSNVAVGWAPYRDGHWAYIAPWGWTWVDDSPWGFAPYHYGRWAYVRGNWGWVPGPVRERPVYAPALVAFVGGASIGISSAPVGWFPLGPHEVYNPWYHASRGYYTNVNVTNIYERNGRSVVMENINNHYNYFRDGRPVPNERFLNREAPHAFTAMSGQDFAAARNAQHHMMAVDPQRFAGAQVMPRGAGVRPEQASFAPARSGSGRTLPAGGFDREVVARNAPAASFGARAANAAPAGGQHAFQGPTNVRLLNGQAQGNRPAGGFAPNRSADMSSAGPAGQPGMRQPAMQDNERAAMRPGEMPSARFAHSREDMPTIERATPGNQPRPGVSYIPSAESDRARAQPSAGVLPNVPRVERAPAGPDNEPRYQRESAVQRPEFQQPRNVAPPPSVEPQQRAAQPQQRGYETPQRAYEPPRGNQAPQPQPRPAQNAGQPHEQPHSQPHHDDRRKDDQHN